MRKKISRRQYRFLEETLNDSVDRGIIEKTKKKDILAYYDVQEGLDFIKVLVTIGAILIGLGILLIIVSNWAALPAFGQLAILAALLSTTMGASLYLKENKPMTAHALLYLALLIFGASLFLINQGFNFNIATNTLFFVWTLGAVLLSSMHKDILLFLASHVLALIFVLNSLNDFIFIQLIALLVIFFGGNYYYNYRKILTFATLALMMVYIIYTLNYFDVTSPLISLIIFTIGILLYHLKHELNYVIFQLVGLLNIGIAGFILTFPEQWQQFNFIDTGSSFSIPFSIALIIYSLALVSRRQIVPLVTISALILRYYFDTLFDFLPRALFFIIGGIIILGLGYFIEKYRKKGGGSIV